MCPLGPPQNQHIFKSHLNYLSLKLSGLLIVKLELALGGTLIVVHMQQMFGTDIQDK